MRKPVHFSRANYQIVDDSILTPIYKIFTGDAYWNRFGFTNQYSSIDWSEKYDPIPVISSSYSVDIKDIVDARTRDILSKYSGANIAVSWSGGVDSTAIVASLIKNGVDKDKLYILASKNSIAEYKKFADWCQAQGYHVIYDATAENYLIHQIQPFYDVILNGNCADQLYGTIIFTRNPNDYTLSIREGIAKNTHNLLDTEIDRLVSIWQDTGKQMGLDVQTYAQFGWLYNFSCKWNYVKYVQQDYLLVNKIKTPNITFFDTPEFQEWAMNHYGHIMEHNPFADFKWYKKDLKEYINDVFPDEDYLLNKSKQSSIGWGGNSCPNHLIARFDDGTADIFGLPEKMSCSEKPAIFRQIFEDHYLK